MNKGIFKVGDLVKGLATIGRYDVVNRDMISGEIIDVKEEPYPQMCIKVIKHNDSRLVGRKVWVKNEDKFFRKIGTILKTNDPAVKPREIKVGNRVKTLTLVGNEPNRQRLIEGTVIDIKGVEVPFLVEFDNYISGHNGLTKDPDVVVGKHGHCWWCYGDDLKVITKDHNETFKVGDRVRCTYKVGLKDLINQVGTVVETDRGGYPTYLVEFDNNVGGHVGNGDCKQGHGWWCFGDDLRRVKSEAPKQVKVEEEIKPIKPTKSPENKFKAGDRVKTNVAVGYGGKGAIGSIGTVIAELNTKGSYTVEFDKNINGHNGLNTKVIGEDKHCWNLAEHCLELVVDAAEKTFRVGDRVKCVTPTYDEHRCVGKCGTVVCVYDFGVVAVEFDEYINGHNCDGSVKNGHGWNCHNESLINLSTMDVPDWSIQIHSEGNKTVARLYEHGKFVKEAIARKHPDDVYDRTIGVAQALDRLIGLPKAAAKEETYFTGKVVCIETDFPFRWLTVGKIYEFEDGVGYNNVGGYICTDKVHSVKEINDVFAGHVKFIEVVE